ncbi:hypothetical protein [uncultured Caulobacter sp.]|uniref:hypothetical protein n=1 Tax=uncultured Caulobacter sp. TaxID=158749 RepID=UPI002614A2EB|nr:hypothetical protein [uncultured Caulobacter sp.]
MSIWAWRKGPVLALRAMMLVGALAALTGCAAIRGAAKPVSPVDTRLALIKTYPEDQVYRAFYKLSDACDAGETACRGGLGRTDYRDMIVALYLSAADARYEEFRLSLSREAKGTAFGGNLAVLIMNGAAVVSGNEARRALAAGSAVVSGGQAAVSKDLFVEKTLPAVLASMDANRSTARAAIITKLRLGADEYTLPEAISDVRALEGQARLDEAVQTLTTTAAADAAAKKKVLDAAYMVKLQGPLAARKQALLLDLQALDDEKLGQAAQALGAPTAAGRAEQTARIRVWFNANVQSDAAFDQAVARVKSLTGKEAYH